jgi:hypothetical protein
MSEKAILGGTLLQLTSAVININHYHSYDLYIHDIGALIPVLPQALGPSPALATQSRVATLDKNLIYQDPAYIRLLEDYFALSKSFIKCQAELLQLLRENDNLCLQLQAAQAKLNGFYAPSHGRWREN